MPDSVSFDLKQLVRVCLNDPELRAEVFAAIDQGPLPVGTSCMQVAEGEQSYQAVLATNRHKSPGEPNFIARDGLGWVSGTLTETPKTPG